MQLDPEETRSIWWKGALKSGLKETLRGLAIGFVAAGVLFGLAQFSVLAPMLSPMVATASNGFNPIIITAFCTVISGVTGLFTGGGQAVAAFEQHHQDIQNQHQLYELGGRVRKVELEQSVHTPEPSRRVQQILERGPRKNHSLDAAPTSEQMIAR